MWPFSRRPDIEELARRGDLPGLLRELREGDRRLVDAAVRALGRLEAPGTTEALIAALGQGVAPAATALAIRAEPVAVPSLIEALGAEDPMVGQAARAALEAMRATDALTDAVRGHPRPAGRELAIRALQALFDAPDLLTDALADPDPGVRRAALRAGAKPDTGHWDHPEQVRALEKVGWVALPVLERALSSPRVELRVAAAETFTVISARDGMPSSPGGFETWLDMRRLLARDPEPAVRAIFARSLRDSLDHASRSEMLSDPSPLVRQAAAESMAPPDLDDATAELLANLRQGDWAAARALGRLRVSSALPALITALDDPRVGGAAAEALADLGDPRAIPALVTYVGRTKRTPRGGGEPDDVDLAQEAIERLKRVGWGEREQPRKQ